MPANNYYYTIVDWPEGSKYNVTIAARDRLIAPRPVHIVNCST